MKNKRVIVVGGGASGIIAAICAAKNKADVILIEQKEQIGKKILATGNGKCNLTNINISSAFYRCDNISFVEHILSKNEAESIVKLFEDFGLILRNRGEGLYPYSEQASTVLDLLKIELSKANVNIITGEKVVEIMKDSKFFVRTEKGSYSADSLVIATGGKASPNLGSDGSGYKFAKSQGHHLSTIAPALVALKGKENFYKEVSGVRCHAAVQIEVDGMVACRDVGELQLTDYGISGIPVFQVSRYASIGLQKKQNICAEIDFMPDISEQQFFELMTMRKEKNSTKTMDEFCVGLFHKKICNLLLKLSGIKNDVAVSEIKENKFLKLLHLCKHLRLEIIDTKGFEFAQVCAGGVKTTEINPDTMESKLVSDLYFTGEILDVDGVCGGYNLHWAWVTGKVAGEAAARKG